MLQLMRVYVEQLHARHGEMTLDAARCRPLQQARLPQLQSQLYFDRIPPSGRARRAAASACLYARESTPKRVEKKSQKSGSEHHRDRSESGHDLRSCTS